MMREFQAEDDRRQTIAETNLTTLINATANHTNLKSTSNDQSQIPSSSVSNKQQVLSENDSKQSKINANTLDSQSFIDRNKLNIKIANRLTTSNTLKVRLFFIFQFLHLLYSIDIKTFDT